VCLIKQIRGHKIVLGAGVGYTSWRSSGGVVLDCDPPGARCFQREGGGLLNKMGRSVVATETDGPDRDGQSGP
jgi:hypothetical protein